MTPGTLLLSPNHRLNPHYRTSSVIISMIFFIACEIISLRWWKWHPDHSSYIQAMVSIRSSQFWSDQWLFFLFDEPKIFWNLLEYASYLFQVGIFRSDPFVSPSTHQFEFISTFAPFPILPRRPIYFSSNNHQTSSHKSYLPTPPIIANWRRCLERVKVWKWTRLQIMGVRKLGGGTNMIGNL